MLTIERDIRLAGVGYEGLGLDEFIRRLQLSGVTLLVDVRLNPISRKRGFSKTALAGALGEAGIAYEHLRELGNPKWNRAGFGGSAGELANARETYAEGLRSPSASECLDRIAAAARLRSVALMCFEADEQRCHRDVVLNAVRDRLSFAMSA
ncbi:hypothetical protein GCM10009555_082790 [Acrocarpospora macrocephala]|uniref:DUF488 domain-containing protein n=1 Tax=Acrocarpospora macrocephala TaxID=150177 RepID=A0A5M3X871_9ACTN|nr:DUF488 domain-containing protein [Acrocarpospora macrocephala]GES16369.1 hypothetical protein Amac_099670 [Acrocarpospora macrocephala]